MYQGKKGMVWFTGVVEDRNDPLALNRVRIRIYGAHTHDKQMIATPDLPWSEVMMPTTSASLSGLGKTTHGLVEGSTVMGFYRDSLDQQDPVVIGSLVGLPQSFYRIDETIDDKGTRSFTKHERVPTAGFNDPRLDTIDSYKETEDGDNPAHINRDYGLDLALDTSPRRDGETKGVSYPKKDYIDKKTSDVNLLAKGDTSYYPVINTVKGEPDRTNYVAPKYPFNHVQETESGHVIELDDTPDKERIHLYHRKGTRFEIDKDGTSIEKVVKDKYTLILGKDTVKIQGTVDIEVGESIIANSIAAAGGAEKLSKDAIKDIVTEDNDFTDSFKDKLRSEGFTDEQIESLEFTDGPLVLGVTTKFKVRWNDQVIGNSTESAIGRLADEESVKDDLSFNTITGTVKSFDTETNSGVDSIVKRLSEESGGLSTETQEVISESLKDSSEGPSYLASILGKKKISVNNAIDSVESKLKNLEDETLDKVGVTAVKEKLDSILTEATGSVDALTAELTEKVTESVTEAASDILGEELGAKLGDVVSEQVSSAVTSAALSAVAGVLGSNLVNVSVGGSAKITTMGSTTVQSLGGSTNITSALGTNITTLTGNTNVTQVAGTLNLTSPVTNITSPIINTTGVLNHTGAMNITGLLTSTAIKSPVIQSGATFLATHKHPIPTGSSAGRTLVGIG